MLHVIFCILYVDMLPLGGWTKEASNGATQQQPHQTALSGKGENTPITLTFYRKT